MIDPALPHFPLPLPNQPPAGYGWEERDFSELSTTTAFITGIDSRDQFLGQNRCVICGLLLPPVLQDCHIVPQAERYTWTGLMNRGWIPSQAKNDPTHEPRNGLLVCANHHLAFDSYFYFIRFLPEIKKFVFVNYSGAPHLQEFHGKAIALDIKDRHAPFPSLFIIHEMRVRGFHPFAHSPDIPSNIAWQDWISLGGVFDDVASSFKRNAPPRNSNNSVTAQSQSQFPPATTNTGGTSSGGRTLALNEDVVADILAATHAMPSWKACQVEGTSWSGTAEENIQTYVSSIGV